MLSSAVVSAAPVADFTGTPTSGTTPLSVTFIDTSTGLPTGWAWFFGDENYAPPWTLMNASAEWTPRWDFNSVAMPDGSIVLIGGIDGIAPWETDVWRSTNNGITWTQMNASTGWTPRWGSSSVAMPDGSIIMTGGWDGSSGMNDTWRSVNNGATWAEVNISSGWPARSMHTTVAMPDSSIILMGGSGSINRLNDVWRSADYGVTWVEINSSGGWSGRQSPSSVVLPDGSIVLMGGYDDTTGRLNDVWRSADKGATWTEVNAGAGWTPRDLLCSVAMPDGSMVMMGGADGGYPNDVWRSADKGVTWTEVNASAGWVGRQTPGGTVAMPDGSIILMGGTDGTFKNDVWRFQPAGSSVQSPSHTYTSPGIYNISLTSRNANGYNTTLKSNYLKVSDVYAGFTWSCNATVPYRVDFHSTSTTSYPPIGSLWWTFGDGATDMPDNTDPMHTYAGTTPLNVTLQVWDALNVESDAVQTVTPCSLTSPYISAMADRSIGPVGTIFTFTGSNTYGTSPNVYTASFVANTTDGSGPLGYGVKPANLSVQTVTGVNVTANQSVVHVTHAWSYLWNTAAISGGSLLPGSSYTFYFVNRTANRSVLTVGGSFAWTKVTVGIEGPLSADYAVSPVSGTAPLDVTFNDLTTGFPEVYNLSFGDGTWANTTDLSSATHTYSTAGTFGPVLYVNNSISSTSGTNTTYPVITVSTANSSAIIGPGETVYIGESGLNITTAVPAGDSIAWWASPAADLNSTAPTTIILPADRSNYFIAPSDFVGQTGNWYVYAGGPPVTDVAFVVKDPQIDMGIKDISTGTDITNGTIPHGDELEFLINSNLYNGPPGTPISLVVQAPGGSTYSALTNKSGTITTLGSVLVSSQPYHTGGVWNTANGLYPDGVYSVHAECNLNGMKDNYKDGGADYVGKTVTQTYTVTLTSPTSTPTESANYNGDGGSDTGPAPAEAPPAAPPAPPAAPPAVQPPAAQPANNPEGPAAPAAAESFPMGFTGMSFNAEGDSALAIDMADARAAGATVTTYFNRVEVYQHHSPGVLITFWGDRFNVNNGFITGKVSRAEFATDPLSATLDLGNVSGSVHAVLPVLTQRVLINNTISAVVSDGTRDQFSGIATSNGLTLQDIAYTMEVTKVNLTTGPANITFTVPPSWVNQNGGKDAVHITRISEDTGKTELLATSYTGLDPQGNMIFRGDSPNGTSLFGLVTAQASAAEQKAHPNVTYIPASKPAMITNIGMFGWLLDIIQSNPVLLVGVIAIIVVLVYFGWWKRRL